eukprot:symbB.v1.2.001872.t1/scaffold79.1/size344139/3
MVGLGDLCGVSRCAARASNYSLSGHKAIKRSEPSCHWMKGQGADNLVEICRAEAAAIDLHAPPKMVIVALVLSLLALPAFGVRGEGLEGISLSSQPFNPLDHHQAGLIEVEAGTGGREIENEDRNSIKLDGWHAARNLVDHANEPPAARRLRRQQEQAQRRGRRGIRYGQMGAHNACNAQLPGHIRQVGSKEGERSVLVLDSRDHRLQSPFQGWLLDEILTNANARLNVVSDLSGVKLEGDLLIHLELRGYRSDHDMSVQICHVADSLLWSLEEKPFIPTFVVTVFQGWRVISTSWEVGGRLYALSEGGVVVALDYPLCHVELRLVTASSPDAFGLDADRLEFRYYSGSDRLNVACSTCSVPPTWLVVSRLASVHAHWTVSVEAAEEEETGPRISAVAVESNPKNMHLIAEAPLFRKDKVIVAREALAVQAHDAQEEIKSAVLPPIAGGPAVQPAGPAACSDESSHWKEAAIKSLVSKPMGECKKLKLDQSDPSNTPLLDKEQAERSKWAARLEAIGRRAGSESKLLTVQDQSDELSSLEMTKLRNLVLLSGAPRTMAVHVRSFEKFEQWSACNFSELYPLTTDRVLKYCIHLDQRECGPSVIPAFKISLKWVASRLAIDLPDLDDRRLRAIQESVVVNRAKALREAKPFPIESIGPMEEFVCADQHEDEARIFVWWILCMIFASLRFDDAVHVKPADLQMKDEGMFGIAWQTKVDRRRRGTRSVQWMRCLAARDEDLDTWTKVVASEALQSLTAHSCRVTLLDAAVHAGRSTEEIGLQANWKNPGPLVLKYTRDRSSVPATTWTT